MPSYLKALPARTTLVVALALVSSSVSALAETILFVGNSFTYGEAAGGPNLVQPFGSGTVTDLNGTGVGGVPALFKAFTQQAGLDYTVSLETVGGTGLDYHYTNKLGLLNRSWDHVVLQSYSTLDASAPGNPAKLVLYAGLLANTFHTQNANVRIHLDATWSRADLTYRTASPWLGKDIGAMQRTVEAGYRQAAAASPYIKDVIPVGAAWYEAMLRGVADPNPYDGIAPGQINLWAPDNYHASASGYYLEALMMFGQVTGRNPLSLGRDEAAARAIGISPELALTLQAIASDQLAVAVPEPASLALFGVGLLGLGLVRRRRAA